MKYIYNYNKTHEVMKYMNPKKKIPCGDPK